MDNNQFKLVKIGGISILAGIMGFVAFKVVKSVAKNATQTKTLKDMTGEVNKSNVTLSQSDLTKLCEKIYAAFVDHWYGYKYDDVVDVLKKVQTTDDWNALVQAFGNRPVKRDSDTAAKQNLIWFLNDTSLTSTKKEYEKILTDKGIQNPLGNI
ncbi:MAG: hypothetical protein J6T96_07820 [Bacteroidales bacterium]|nr:hypothetical protein [Bacteroidales bacterium]